jgi:WD40 repeat protein
LFDLDTGRKQPALPGLDSASSIYWECVTFSPGGKQLLVGGVLQEVVGDSEVFERSEIRVWDLTTWTLEKTLKVDEFVRSIAFSPDGSELAVGCGGRQKAPNRQRGSDETVVESRGVVFRWETKK